MAPTPWWKSGVTFDAENDEMGSKAKLGCVLIILIAINIKMFVFYVYEQSTAARHHIMNCKLPELHTGGGAAAGRQYAMKE